MKESTFVKAHTIKEVSKQIQVPSGTIRQWEKDLEGILVIPRTKQGARYYTETEITLLIKIKQMREKNLGKEMIRELLQRHLGGNSEPASESFEAGLVPFSGFPNSENTSHPTTDLMPMLNEFKDHLLDEIKNELRNGVRREIVEEVKKEISKGTLQTVKSISDSIYKSAEKTKDEIKTISNQLAKTSERTSETMSALSNHIVKSSEHTSKKIKSLESKIAKTSIHTAETIEALSNNIVMASEHNYETIETLTFSIAKSSETTTETVESLSNSIANVSKQTSEAVEALSATIGKTAEMNTTRVKNLEANMAKLSDELVEGINIDREYYIETINNVREQLSHEVGKREAAFQDMVESFREAAPAKEKPKKRWSIWNKK